MNIGNASTSAWVREYVSAAIDDLAAGRPVRTAETKAYGCSVKYR